MRTFTFTLLMLLAGLVVAQIPTNGRICHLPLDGTPADSEGYFDSLRVNDAGATIPAAGDRFGNATGAVIFNNTDPANSAYFIQGIPASLDLPDTAFTLAVWIMPTDKELYSTIFNIRLNQAVAPYNSIWMGILSNGQVAGSVSTTDNGDAQLNAGEVNGQFLNRWTHVALSYSAAGSSLKLYLNGVLASTRVVTGNLSYTASPKVTIGNQETQPYHRFFGRMDDMMFYNRALTADEVSSFAGISSGRISYLPFDGNATDSEGYFDSLRVNLSGVTIPASVDRNGSPSGAVIFNSTVQTESAYYIQGLPASLDLPDTAFTLTTWVLPYEVELYSTIFNIRLNQAVAPFNTIWMGVLSDGQFAGSITTNVETDVQANGGINGTTDFNTWSHVAMTYSAAEGSLKLYVNGVMVDNKGIAGSLFYNGSPKVTIGNQETQPEHRLFGSLDDMMLYNRALTADEIGTFVGIFSSADAAPTAPAVRLVPNPARDVVQVQTAAHVQSIRLLDLTGKVIREAATAAMEVADLPAGLYLMQVQTAQGMAVERFVKE